MDDKELEIFTEQNEDGLWVARIIHRPSGTIKISDLYDIRDEAIDNAREGIEELIKMRREGFGS